MFMILQNDTSIQIECVLKNDKKILIPPKSKINVEFDKECILEMYHPYKSSCKNFFDVDDTYYIVIDSKINILCCQDDSKIIISGEIVHFDLGYVYDKFFFCAHNCQIIKESCAISGLDKLQEAAYEPVQKDSHFERIVTFLLSGNFLSVTTLFLLVKLAFWANNWSFPIWLIVVFWAFGYIIQLLGEKTTYKYRNKQQPKLSQLTKYTSIEYVTTYFENPNRKWIATDKIVL